MERGCGIWKQRNWIQHVFQMGRAKLQKINGKLNPADLYTKYLSRSEIVYHMSFLGHTLYDNHGHEVGNKNIDEEWAEDYQPESSCSEGSEPPSSEYWSANDENEAAVAAMFSVGCVARSHVS